MTDVLGSSETGGADTIDTNRPVDTLPPGLHPLDARLLGPDTHDLPVPEDTYGDRAPRGRKPWSTDNEDALATFERASHSFDVRTLVLSGTTQLVGRQPGRKAVILSVPTKFPDGSTPGGVIFGPNRGVVDAAFSSSMNGDVGIVNPGDTYTLYTEAPLYAAPVGGASTGGVQVTVLYNPAGGGLDS